MARRFDWAIESPGVSLVELPELVYEPVSEFDYGYMPGLVIESAPETSPEVAALADRIIKIASRIVMLLAAGEIALHGEFEALRAELTEAQRLMGGRRD